MYLSRYLAVSDVFFFFFQAEDGIRDTSVTGVQTCALPISKPLRPGFIHGASGVLQLGKRILDVRCSMSEELFLTSSIGHRTSDLALRTSARRSEERRVGKECRSRWWADHDKKKEKKRRSR